MTDSIPLPPSFTCSRCHMTSYHPDDIRESYCGNCHDWTYPELVPDRPRVKSACPSCGAVAERMSYDIGSGPELSCANCEWCWGAAGQPLDPVSLVIAEEAEHYEQLPYEEGGSPDDNGR